MLKQSFEYELPIYILHIIIDEDMAGDYLLAEAKFPLNQVLPQMQKKFQICLEKPDLRVSLMLTYIDTGVLLRLKFQAAHPILNKTLATDQKWPLTHNKATDLYFVLYSKWNMYLRITFLA